MKALESNLSIAMDNCNQKIHNREEIIKEAKKRGYKVYCIKTDFTKQFALRMNNLRKFGMFREEGFSEYVPSVAIHTAAKVWFFFLIFLVVLLFFYYLCFL
jgi:hypothetical protein